MAHTAVRNRCSSTPPHFEVSSSQAPASKLGTPAMHHGSPLKTVAFAPSGTPAPHACTGRTSHLAVDCHPAVRLGAVCGNIGEGRPSRGAAQRQHEWQGGRDAACEARRQAGGVSEVRQRSVRVRDERRWHALDAAACPREREAPTTAALDRPMAVLTRAPRQPAGKGQGQAWARDRGLELALAAGHGSAKQRPQGRGGQARHQEDRELHRAHICKVAAAAPEGLQPRRRVAGPFNTTRETILIFAVSVRSRKGGMHQPTCGHFGMCVE